MVFLGIQNVVTSSSDIFYFFYSAATLPVTIRCVTETNKVDRRVSMFVLPIGATCNMDGTAIYFSVVVIFIANLEGVSLTFGELVLTM